jgi:hypothetical protein
MALLRRPDIRRSWQLAKAEFASVVAERDQLRAERDEALARLTELQNAVTARWQAEAELRALYRERDLQRAMRMERDPATPLN